jgi:pyrroloquinoline quinone (PQQ) biosynthesis protein C
MVETVTVRSLSHPYDWSRSAPYPVDEFFSMVGDLVERQFYGYAHPLGRRLLAGELDRDQLRFLAAQEFRYYEGTTWWNAYKVANADLLAHQRELHGPLLDELGTDLVEPAGVAAHSELFLRYCEGLGLSKEEVLSHPIVPGVLLAITELMRIARERPAFEFLACSNLVVERMRPRFYTDLLRTFREHYRWVPPSSLFFYELHAEQDKGHSSLGRRIVARYVGDKRDQDQVFSVVLRSLGLRHAMYDSILLALESRSSLALDPWPNFPRDPWPRPSSSSRD